MGKIARVREQELFAVLETTTGQLKMPTQADCVVLAGSITANQKPNYTNSPEMQNSRGVLARFQDAFTAGEFSFSIIPRPRAAGTEPVGGALFESLLGQKTIVPATSVTYSQALAKPSLSIAYRKGFVTYYLIGAVVNEMKLKAEKKGPILLDVSGQFMTRISVGDDVITLDPGIAGATDVQVTDGLRFMVGGLVMNATQQDTNNATGYEIIAINGNVLTLGAGTLMDWAVGDAIQGFLPASSLLGNPIEGQHTVVKIDAAVGKLSALDLTIQDPAQFLDQEINGSLYPTEYVEGERQISGSVKSYFRLEDSPKLIQAASGAQEVTLDVELGPAQPGQRMKISMPRVPLEVPSEEADGPALVLSQNFVALEQNGEDSLTILFN